MKGDNSVVEVYYNVDFDKKLKKSKVDLIIVDKNEKILCKCSEKVNSDTYLLAEIKAINIILNELECLEDKEKISGKIPVYIYGKDFKIIEILSSNRSRGKMADKFEKVILKLQWHKNWKVILNTNVKNTMRKIIERTKRFNNYVKSNNAGNDEEITLKSLIKNEDTKIIFYDLEMNCLEKRDLKNDWEIISIGAVKCNSELKIYRDNMFYHVIKPRINRILSDKCKEITGMKQRQVDLGDGFNFVLRQFEGWVGDIDNTVFVTWGGEDLKVLLKNQLINNCNLDIFDAIKDSNHDFQIEFSNYLKTNQQFSLVNALKMYEQEFEGEVHNALYDALNLANLYVAYRKNILGLETSVS